jgi:hypothetical protein
MRAGRRILLSALAAAAIGCDRSPAPAPLPPAATQPITAAPATVPARPAKAIFFVGDLPVDFPPAKIVFEPRDGDMRVVLLSDDPPAAARDRYMGNSFYFDLLLEKTTEADMDGAAVAFPESLGDGREDRDVTTTGLFVDNGRQRLSPAGAKISFEKNGPDWNVRVAGAFRLTDARSPDAPPQGVVVNAVLSPKAAVKD